MDDDYTALTNDIDLAERNKRMKFKQMKRFRFIFALIIFAVLTIVVITCLRYSWFTIMPLHASCRIEFNWQKTNCDSVNEALVSQIKNWTGRENCLNGGQKCLYNLVTASSDYIKATHTTPVKGYVDTLTFQFINVDNISCKAEAFSSSNLWYAVLDYGTNYCNIENLIQGAGLDVKDSTFLEVTSDKICTQFSSADCSIY